MSRNGPLVGSVFERNPVAHDFQTATKFGDRPTSGFPVAEHRNKSKSAFARRREAEQLGKSPLRLKVSGIPPESTGGNSLPLANDDCDSWRAQVSSENEARVASMTDGEREAERRELSEQFGENLLKRVMEARARKVDRTAADNDLCKGSNPSLEEVPITPEVRPHKSTSNLQKIEVPVPSKGRLSFDGGSSAALPSALATPSSTRASTPRQLRFATLTQDDVHIYPSAPSSPKEKRVLALPPPSDESGDDVVHLGSYKPAPLHAHENDKELFANSEEGSPEYIRRRYFPSHAQNEPSLEWISSPDSTKNRLPEDGSSKSTPESNLPFSSVRFDLHGSPIPIAIARKLPTHLGLHHHAPSSDENEADQYLAGYTIDDIFFLARSTVASQRAAMLDVMKGILPWMARLEEQDPELIKNVLDAGYSLPGETKLIDIRKRILSVAITVLSDRSPSLVVRAVDLAHDAVSRKPERNSVSGFLDQLTLSSLISPLPSVLERIDVERDTKVQILDTLLSLVLFWTPASPRPRVNVPRTIMEANRLVASVVTQFVTCSQPLGKSVDLFTLLAKRGRKEAELLVRKHGLGEILARIIIQLELGDSSLLLSTLLFFVTTTQYGLGATIVQGDVALGLSRLGHRLFATDTLRHDSDPGYHQCQTAFLQLVHNLLTLAQDPHCSTPVHSITWTAVEGFGFGDDLKSYMGSVLSERPGNAVGNKALLSRCAELLHAVAAYIEGVQCNYGMADAEKGAATRREVAEVLNETTLSDADIGAVLTEAENSDDLETLAESAELLSGYLRLCSSLDLPLSGPVQTRISELAGKWASNNGLWTSVGNSHRYLVEFLATSTRFVATNQSPSPETAVGSLPLVLSRLLPGDEQTALWILDVLLPFVSQTELWQSSPLVNKVDLADVKPFLIWGVKPWKVKLGAEVETGTTDGGEEANAENDEEEVVVVAPLRPSTVSLKEATTLVVPWDRIRSPQRASTSTQDALNAPLPSRNDDFASFRKGLPLSSVASLLFSPLDHLMRSGVSPVFRSDVTIQRVPQNPYGSTGEGPKRDWNPTEIEIVRACLGLALVVLDNHRSHEKRTVLQLGITRDEVVMACMKVFMLEHGVGSNPTQGGEVFRDDLVEILLARLTSAFMLQSPVPSEGGGRHPESTRNGSDLEEIADRTLPTTFYTFFSDYLSLYDSISFGHPTFTALLLPPLSMRYASDYRKLFWVDYSHLLGTLDIAESSAIVRDSTTGLEALAEWLYPVERDANVIDGYFRALIGTGRNGVYGFLRMIAVHHVALTIWQEGEESTERRKTLLRILLENGGEEAAGQVMNYYQEEGKIQTVPLCLECPEDEKSRRKIKARTLLGDREDLISRVDMVLS